MLTRDLMLQTHAALTFFTYMCVLMLNHQKKKERKANQLPDKKRYNLALWFLMESTTRGNIFSIRGARDTFEDRTPGDILSSDVRTASRLKHTSPRSRQGPTSPFPVHPMF